MDTAFNQDDMSKARAEFSQKFSSKGSPKKGENYKLSDIIQKLHEISEVVISTDFYVFMITRRVFEDAEILNFKDLLKNYSVSYWNRVQFSVIGFDIFESEKQKFLNIAQVSPVPTEQPIIFLQPTLKFKEEDMLAFFKSCLKKDTDHRYLGIAYN